MFKKRGKEVGSLVGDLHQSTVADERKTTPLWWTTNHWSFCSTMFVGRLKDYFVVQTSCCDRPNIKISIGQLVTSR